jgi:FtsH-binding integral membrane protein
MPLAPCPDCGHEVSTAAPACIHCGRPLAAAAAPAPPKPIAGIVIACVVGLPTLIWSLLPGDPTTADLGPAQGMSRGVHMFGCTALLIGAMLSLAGHRRGNAVVRGTSWVMIAVLGAILLMILPRASAELTPEFGSGYVVPFMIIMTGFMLGPWLLYLYLFRRSKYP